MRLKADIDKTIADVRIGSILLKKVFWLANEIFQDRRRVPHAAT